MVFRSILLTLLAASIHVSIIIGIHSESTPYLYIKIIIFLAFLTFHDLRLTLFDTILVFFEVELIALICDAPQRAECKGIVGHSGYYACERCTVKGEVDRTKTTAVRFPIKPKCDPRTDERWDKYLKPERGEKVSKLFFFFTFSNKSPAAETFPFKIILFMHKVI